MTPFLLFKEDPNDESREKIDLCRDVTGVQIIPRTGEIVTLKDNRSILVTAVEWHLGEEEIWILGERVL